MDYDPEPDLGKITAKVLLINAGATLGVAAEDADTG
jgi:hypothetical protein